MARFNNPLDSVRVASPCNADWDQMWGNDRARFCGHCQLNVYNLSAMTRTEAKQLIERTEGRLCVRYYRRADGSILTRDCPVGLRAIRRRMTYVARALVSAVLSFLAGLGIYEFTRSREENFMGVMAFDSFTLTQGAPVATVDVELPAPQPPAVDVELSAPPPPTIGKIAFTPEKPRVLKRARSK